MRKLIVQQWVTVDNIAAEEDGGLSFVSGEPFDDNTETPFTTNLMGFIDSVDTVILGATTYVQSKDYWPYADEQGEYGRKLNGLTKFVASSTLDAEAYGPKYRLPSFGSFRVRSIRGKSSASVILMYG